MESSPMLAISSPPTASEPKLYDRDFYAWTETMAEALRSHHWSALDIENLVEEVESLGRRERQELENRLAILLGHLLKWQYQAPQRSHSWRATLREQRRRIQKLLLESPSLNPYIATAIEEAYLDGRDLAIQETNLPDETFPIDCPYDFETAIDAEFLPDCSDSD
jgi:Domain of unknown function DUF29